MTGPRGTAGRPEPGILRAWRADIAREERTRLLDALVVAKDGGKRGSFTAALNLLTGDRAWGYDPDDGPGRLYGSISSACDSLEVFEFDEPDTDGVPEQWPIRIVAVDGACDTVAGAFLTLDEAQQHVNDVQGLIDKIRAARAAELEQ